MFLGHRGIYTNVTSYTHPPRHILPTAISRTLTNFSRLAEQFLLCAFRLDFRTPITKTRLYNFDPLKPHFYIVKLGFTGVYIIFLFLLENIDCGYSLEPPRRGGSNEYHNRRGGSNEYPQSMFWAEIGKISESFIWKFSFFGCKIFSIFE